MKRSKKCAALILVIAALTLQPQALPSAAAAVRSATSLTNTAAVDTEKVAVHAVLQKLASAVIGGQAKVLASLWTTDGSYTDDDGNVVNGRTNLEQRFTSVFQSEGAFPVEVIPRTFRLLANTVALSEGEVKRPNSKEYLDTRYSMVLVKENGQWLISSAVETPVPTQPMESQLHQLDWLIGEWAAENGGCTVKMKSEWSGSKNFILCKFEIKRPNQAALTETQVMGWDPKTEALISWNFDANGGFGHGTWTKKDNQWIVSSSGTRHDGSTTRALNILSMTDPDHFSWQSVNRSVDGSAVPDTNPISVQRVTNATK